MSGSIVAPRRPFIGGAWARGGGDRVEVESAATGQVFTAAVVTSGAEQFTSSLLLTR